jgi:hypothetical protein
MNVGISILNATKHTLASDPINIHNVRHFGTIKRM